MTPSKRISAIFAVTVLAVILLLASCASDSTPRPSGAVVTTSKGGSPDGFWHGKVDGVECIAIYNLNDALYDGISCNWSHADNPSKEGS